MEICGNFTVPILENVKSWGYKVYLKFPEFSIPYTREWKIKRMYISLHMCNVENEKLKCFDGNGTFIE